MRFVAAAVVTLAVLANNVGAQSFSDSFNRPDGSVGNGWTAYGGGASIVGGQLQTIGGVSVGGGVSRTLPVTFPLTFSFDFTTAVPTDGGWFIALNAVSTVIPGAPMAQTSFEQYAGSRNIIRRTTTAFESSPNLPEPIAGWENFGTSPAHIQGLINADLSAVITLTYADGTKVSAQFGPTAPGPIGSLLVLGNSNASPGPHFFRNLSVSFGQAPAITSAAGAIFQVGSAGTFTVNASGALPIVLTEAGPLPAGVTFIDNGNGTGTLSGTPTEGGAFSFNLTATNSGGSATQTFTLVSAAGKYAATVLADHPVAYYRMGETQGFVTASDASGNGHTGSYEGNAILGVPGLINDPDTAVNFNTTGDVSIPDAPSLNFVGTAFTVEAWVYGVSGGAAGQRVFDKATAGAGNGYGLDISNAQIRLLGATNLSSLVAFGAATTYHIVGVADGAGNGSIYVNGVLVASGPYSDSSPYTGAAHIAVANDGSAHFGGVIDEVAVYNHALSPQRILVHYTAGQAAQGVISTVAGGGLPSGAATSAFVSPATITLDKGMNLYVDDKITSSVYSVDTSGQISLFAGNGLPGFSGDGGLATSAQLNLFGYNKVAVDALGNLFIADELNQRVRRVDATTRIITTVAGGGVGGDGGPATSAALVYPGAVALDSVGNLFIVEGDGGVERVRRVDAKTSVITTVAGNGIQGFTGDGGPATNAELASPRGIAVDAVGNLFIADSGNFRIRRVDATTGTITTVAGNGTPASGGDGGLAIAAGMNPYDVAIDSLGNLFIADAGTARVRRVDSTTGLITTVAGNGIQGFSGDGGPSTNAQMNELIGVALDAVGNLFIADLGNGRIRRVNAATGVITTVVGGGTGGDGGLATSAELYVSFGGVAADSVGNLFIADAGGDSRVRRVDVTTGVITTVAGTGTPGFSGDGGPATNAQLSIPLGDIGGVAVDQGANLFIVDSGNARIRRVDATTGTISTYAGGGSGGDGVLAVNAALNFPSGVAVDALANLFIAEFTGQRIRRVDAATGIITTAAGTGTPGFSGDGGPAVNAQLDFPVGGAVDTGGNLYIVDQGNTRVRRVDAKTGVITTVAGGGAALPGDGGPATGAQLSHPSGVAVDPAGNLFIADEAGERIRRVDAATGIITTVAGDGLFGSSGDGGPAISAELSDPVGVALDTTGDLFIAGLGDNRVRRVTGAAAAASRITVTPDPVAFGNVPITTSAAKTITISNSGATSRTISAIGITGNFFTLGRVQPLPIVLAPSATTSFDVIFSPLTTMSSTGTVTITSDAAPPTTPVAVTGNGVPLSVPPATSITLATDQTVYHRGQPVLISGLLSASGNAGISSVAVTLQVSVNGTSRNLTAYTDALGAYRTVFQPASNDGGAFTVTAAATSGGATQTATATFRILGLLVSPSSVSQDVLTGTTLTVPLDITNLGDAPLSNLNYSVTVTPTGALAATLPPSQVSLAAGSATAIAVTLTAPAGAAPPGPVTVAVSISGADPTSGLLESGNAAIVAMVRPAVSVPVLVPANANVGVNPGSSLTLSFAVRNDGYAPMDNAAVALQSPGALNWVALGNSALGTIAPGGSSQFQVVISPPSTVALATYAVPFSISGGSTPLQGTINISVTMLTMGSAAFVVSDDIGAKVSGATVTLYGKTNGKTFQGVTDTTGQLTLSGVDAGDYSYVVAADTHDPANGSVTVTAGAAAQVSVILSYNVVSITFIVTPTTIVDQYNVTLNITYSTTLPKPALQVIPASLDFSYFPEDAPTGRYACSLSVTNTHPTASVRNLVVDASQLDISQPIGQRLRVFFANDAQVYQVGNLAGQGTVSVPCYAVIDGGTVPTHAVGNVAVQANYDFSLDGQVLQGTTTTIVPVSYTRPSELTYRSISFIYDKKTDPANPVLVYDGAGYVYDVKSNRAPVFTLQKPLGAPFDGRNLVAFTETQGGTTIPEVINVNQSNAFWHGDFDSLKQSLLGIGDATTYDISALDCPTSPSCPNGGLTLQQAIASQVAINPNQALADPSYLAFEGQWADGTSTSPYLIPIKITTITRDSITVSRGPASPGSTCDPTDPLYILCKDPLPLPTVLPNQGGQIVIAIDQTIRLERQAFNATLGIGAHTTLNNVVASIQVLDAKGADASSSFFVLVTSDPLGATHGGTVAGQTAVSWRLIPNAGAGGTLPQGAQYQVRATLSYTVGGAAKSATTQAVTITVLPSPKLTVAYSAPFVVVPGKDAKIRVTLKNVGYGTARNLSIQSVQPRIAATLPTNPLLDNPGPLVAFNISGSSNTADGSGFRPGNLTLNFGDLAPGASVSGFWTLQVSQKGFFIDISSTFSHTDYQGIALDPLILPPTTRLVPAIAGTVTTSSGQSIPGLTVDLTASGPAIGSDQTDASGVYYIQDLVGGNFVEEVRDLSGAVLATKNIAVLQDQATNFIDFVIPSYNPTQAVIFVNSNPPGLAFTADGTSYTTPHSFQWQIGSNHTLGASSTIAAVAAASIQKLAAPAAVVGSTSETLVGWSDGETATLRGLTVGTFGATFIPLYRPTAEVNQYARTQITTDLVDHKWPSMNSLGDMVWSQKDSLGNWQVFKQGPSTANVRTQVTSDQHNHERPVISDDGTIAWFQDSTGGGLGYAIERLHPGSSTAATVEFSSRNFTCNPLTGVCNPPQEHAAGKTFGIASNGQTISYYTFYQYGIAVDQPFDVSGIGKLPQGSSPPANFYGYESPDINSQSDIVYGNGFVPGVNATNRYVWLATTTQPFTQTLIDQGQYPHVSDRSQAGGNPEIVYLQNNVDVTHWPGSAPSKWVALGLWADIVGTGSSAKVVYECLVNGVSQVCTATPTPVAPDSISVTTNLPAATFTITESTGAATFSGGGTSFLQTNAPPGSYRITYGAVPGYKTPPTETQILSANGAIAFVGTYSSDIVASLVDPIPGLSSGSAIITSVNPADADLLASGGRAVTGVAADGVTEVLVRIPADNVGDQFDLTLFNDQSQQSGVPAEDGALGNPGDTTFALSDLTVTAIPTSQGPMAFAVYQAPIDFPRTSGQDTNANVRSVSIQVQLVSSGASTIVPVTILRPPVFLIHGIWDDASLWIHFAPLYGGPGPADSRFYVGLANYNAPIKIASSVPSISQLAFKKPRQNALGFDYNANVVLGQIQGNLQKFKNGQNPQHIPVASIQFDIVAHSMGGVITRTLALQPTFFSADTFGQGNVHKAITIDTPHLGTPLANQMLSPLNLCLQIMFAQFGQPVFDSVMLSNGSFSTGAVGDFQGDGLTYASLSPALKVIRDIVTVPIPTAFIAGMMSDSNLQHLLVSGLTPGSGAALEIRKACGINPLTLSGKLTPLLWPGIFGGQPSDGIVPLSSQLNGLGSSNGTVEPGYIHSDGTKLLGFGAPAITDDPGDPQQTIPNRVIDFLNTPISDSAFVRLNP
jgi:sugar lactone lactonase YvrE